MNAPAEPAAARRSARHRAASAYRSRLLVGTGKYRDFAQTREAIVASGAQIVTVAIRRTNLGQDANAPSLLDALPPSEFTYLPNSAGCYTADDAVRTLKLARELLDGHALTKLEVLGDANTLFPNVRETLKAAERLVADGFQVMVYTSDDPIIARELEQIGCVAIMPLASLIGSGMGILNPWNLKLIIEQAKVPVLVDAGVGTASDAAIAMELGCAGVLMNTAIALAQDPVRMARAMRSRSRPAARRSSPAACRASSTRPSPSSPTSGLISMTHAASTAARCARGPRSHARWRLRPAPAQRRRPAQIIELCKRCRRPGALRPPDRAGADETAARLAERDGDTLRVTLFPSGVRHVPRQRSRERREDVRAVGLLDRINAVVLFATDGEQTGFVLLQRATGKQFRLPAEPVLSPDRQRLVTADFCASGCDNELAVWRVTRDGVRKELAWKPPAPWSDANAAWKDADTLRVEYTVDGETTPRTLERRLAASGWAKR